MKATGIVRRIDELGRVVIPKEIRKTMRIRESDPLEIFTDKDGEIILKKYSPIGDLIEFSRGYTEAINKSINKMVLICDKDTIVSVSGGSKKEYLDKKISKDLEKIIEQRRPTKINLNEPNSIIEIYEGEDHNNKYSEQIIAPIVSEGDTTGAVIITSKENNKMGDLEFRIAEFTSSLLAQQMEN